MGTKGAMEFLLRNHNETWNDLLKPNSQNLIFQKLVSMVVVWIRTTKESFMP